MSDLLKPMGDGFARKMPDGPELSVKIYPGKDFSVNLTAKSPPLQPISLDHTPHTATPQSS